MTAGVLAALVRVLDDVGEATLCARAMSRAAARTNSVRRWGSMASSITRGSNASSTMASYRNPAHVGT